MTPKQRTVLAILADHTDPEENILNSSYIAKCSEGKLTQRQAWIAARSLVRQGLAQRCGYFDEGTGLLAGSGYTITEAGRQAWQSS